MSAYALIIGHPHAADAPPVVISGPEVPLDDQRARYKREFMAASSNDEFRLVQFLDSRRGVRKRKSFVTSKELKRRARELARQQKEAASGTSEEQAAAEAAKKAEEEAAAEAAKKAEEEAAAESAKKAEEEAAAEAAKKAEEEAADAANTDSP